MGAVYTYTESYGGSEILIEMERDVLTAEIGDFTVSLHEVTAYIDEVEQLTEYVTTDNRPPVYKAAADRLIELLQFLKDQIDEVDELDEIMSGLGFSKGSEMLLDYVVTSPAAGEVTHTWTDDPDIINIEIEEATISDYSDAVNIHEGGFSSPINDTGYTSGVTRYFRLRGQRTGEGFGPWSNETIVVS